MDKIIKEASLANSFNKTEVNTEPEEAEVTFFE